MHVVARKALRLFWEKHPEAKPALSHWFKIMSKTDFGNFGVLRGAFPNADKVGDLVVFNIAGNKHRLIASIHFNRNKVYVRNILTHREYDKGAWKR